MSAEVKTMEEREETSVELSSFIASVITAAMQRVDVTQRELAEQTGITQSYISQICSGKKIPTLEKLEKMSRILGISLRDFFPEDTMRAEDTPFTMLTRNEILLIQFYRSMGKKQQKLIFDLAVATITRDSA
ncbi:MAG: helix-turn-helix transcriptional regulator [Clostridia bacterium]|nr:helix-turn-helix transcriptional regulator [Clostridia bacterium]